MKEMLLTSEELYDDLGENIISHYEALETEKHKSEFVMDLKLAVID